MLTALSSDYVFDGSSPPYPPSTATNPLNLYGRTKRDGEVAVLSVTGAKTVALRVPVLYGPTPTPSDSAVNILLDVVSDQSGKTYKMDHFATRYPTNIVDIADFLVRLSTLPPSKTLPPIIHYSAEEPFTKYEMCLVFAKLLGLPHTHIIPQAEEPTDPNASTRPRDAHLYTLETEDLMAGYGGLGWTPFEEWWKSNKISQTRRPSGTSTGIRQDTWNDSCDMNGPGALGYALVLVYASYTIPGVEAVYASGKATKKVGSAVPLGARHLDLIATMDSL
ncbi:hypothetical protein PHLCEN_2v6506 [Hermanssonia centrifuga]|uniref:RmlD-like substrate binding domain-containing protein n=1 Tax=Hermanssonia centrifuga TaxID=98765 RepID=A0A2R6NZD1_9APHY|nr:hypothetical protein PHLCEN_2v6506 [Hermanssonia centrifuga]